MQRIRNRWWAAEKPTGNPSRPNDAWPGFRNTTSSAIKVSKRARSPVMTASIQVVCTSRIARSSEPICNLHCQNSSITDSTLYTSWYVEYQSMPPDQNPKDPRGDYFESLEAHT